MVVVVVIVIAAKVKATTMMSVNLRTICAKTSVLTKLVANCSTCIVYVLHITDFRD